MLSSTSFNCLDKPTKQTEVLLNRSVGGADACSTSHVACVNVASRRGTTGGPVSVHGLYLTYLGIFILKLYWPVSQSHRRRLKVKSSAEPPTISSRRFLLSVVSLFYFQTRPCDPLSAVGPPAAAPLPGPAWSISVPQLSQMDSSQLRMRDTGVLKSSKSESQKTLRRLLKSTGESCCRDR